jgi:hypothetical protein
MVWRRNRPFRLYELRPLAGRSSTLSRLGRSKRLYDAIEAGIAELDDPAPRERIVSLEMTRDQAQADARPRC